MSHSSPSNEENLKAELIETNAEFRSLARAHAAHEVRLEFLQSLAYPKEGERLEISTIKKQKLALKDQMAEIMARYRVGRPEGKAMTAGA